MDETWLPVPGESPDYEISNFGNVRVTRRGTTNPMRTRLRGAYKSVTFFRRGDGDTRWKKVAHSIHRLVALAFIPNPENHPQVNHKDCNKLNNRVENLEWVTALDNTWHAHANGLMRGKSACTKRRLSDQDVADIRAALASGHYTMRELAERFQVSTVYVGRIWRNLDRRVEGVPIRVGRFRTAFYNRKHRKFVPQAVGQATTPTPRPLETSETTES